MGIRVPEKTAKQGNGGKEAEKCAFREMEAQQFGRRKLITTGTVSRSIESKRRYGE